MSTYAIGDVQGCYDDLQRLLEKIQFSDDDTLWFAGDLINRGPQSLQSLEFVYALGERAVCVLGNHDLHLLAAALGARAPHKSDTFDDILNAPNRDELLDWLRMQPLIHVEHSAVMVHAGIYPGWTLTQAQALAEEFHTVLRDHDYADYFQHMYGNQPDRWDDALTGHDRLRFIVNSFTRMRFIDGDGRLDMRESGPRGSQAQGLTAWFEMPNKLPENLHVIFGHWAALGPSGNKRFLSLDSGCVWGGSLTAWNIETGELTCVDCDGAMRY
ncbi:MAG: symmetrical bis(5'-nucleosyl)-tetraphosphatase [Pseudomonadota bacterium]